VKKIGICALLMVLALAGYTQKVDVEELQVGQAVEFINFEGPQPATSRDAIRNIGADMARQLLSGRIKAAWSDKYSAVHLFDQMEADMLGADVITLEDNARVNHINSLRLILAGFLEEHYAYSRTDSETLAFFATIYNAVYRGDMGYLREKYQQPVMDLVEPNTVGLALDYREWPGASEVLVPLTDKAARQDVRSLDTSILTDSRVTAAVRAQPDRAIDERKAMVDIKEREVAVTEEEIDESRERIAVGEEEVSRIEAEVTGKETALAAQEEELAEEKEKVETVTDAEEKARREAGIEEREEQLATEKTALGELEDTAEEKRTEVEAEKEELARAEEDVEEKKAEIESDRRTIARDERLAEVEKAIEEEPEKMAERLVAMEEERKSVPQKEPIVGGKLYYLKVKKYLTDGHYANDLYIIDALTGEFVLKAPEKPHIAGHKYEVVPGEGVLVLTHSGDEKEAHYLTLLDLDTLEVLRTASVDVYHLSFVERRGDYVYAVNFKDPEDCRIGKYSSTTLRLVAESEAQIDRNTVFHMSGDLIFVNSEKKDMLVIDSDTMKVQSTITLP